ncbi:MULTISPECIES: response regulator [Variovorax]|jgi:PAS domain S-box-containing protein|uniref:response regulator n=1 Tax=Variovorax TaxID=34072 RepID=UPI00086EF437|nr:MULTISPECIES: response regulator [Variovorax]MBN8757693.1 response regulator [Variovorax sp.]ODU14264.1 MAG: two-component system sensor histidine kinase/response regulator [Variovorax sp. SCN 67-85]ODV25583.1 MAG: two-component system sensor histidine kinase/response regulator [Variovorax sp. SCN 67-20]OJZ08778.1 MAG: two-component system sensor histidine kinase/response regulator [Variovorax sp. 67-131]UKI11233.1 response regulator [Variovorax paradoxus]
MNSAGGAVAANPQPPGILILEDSRFDVELLLEALSRALPAATTHVVRDERGFVEALNGGGFSLILSDYELPGFSGAHALEVARRLAPETPFVFVSGVIGEDNAVELLKSGATDYVSKGRLARLPVVLERALKESDDRRAKALAERRLNAANAAIMEAEARRLALMELGDRIRDMDEPGDIAYAASEMLGRRLAVDRAGYGLVDTAAETIAITRDWTAPGVASLAGLLHFRDYGSYIDDLRCGVTVAFDDARVDPRTRDTAAALEAITARAAVNMPLTERGGLVGLLYLNHGQVRPWLADELDFIREVGDRVRSAIARREAQIELKAFAESLERQVEARTYERDRTWALSQDLLGVANAQGYFVSVNPAWETVLGWSADEIRALPFRTLVHADDLALTEAELQRLTLGERTTGFENRYRMKSGGYRWLSWTAVPDNGLLYAAARDITEQKERAAELDTAREQLRQSQKLEAVGQLTGGLAHDFNNLLAAISGSLELMRRRGLDGKPADMERYVGVAQGAVKRAASLTHRLLAFSRRQTLEPKPLNANRLVTEMEELLRRTLGPQIALETVAAVGLWNVHADPGQLENALLNLCINARDAMPEGGTLVIETANRWIDARTARGRDLPMGQYVSLTVSDNGVGMPPEVVARAFDPFFTTKPIGMGTGLGLSMIYGFAKQSGGQVRIYSEVGKGTSVSIYLPRHDMQEEVAAAPAETMLAPRADQGDTVLVVDDEPALRMIIVEVMQGLGYATLEAGDGAEALRILQSPRQRIDLLVSDVGLPGGMNGRQVADAARTARPGLKVLFITGYAENAVLSHGHLDPGMHVMTKPFEMDVLARRVKQLIESR